MKFWKRQATLQIGSKRFGMDDLYFKFTVPFEDSEKLGTATIEAYNLSPATRNSIKKWPHPSYRSAYSIESREHRRILFPR